MHLKVSSFGTVDYQHSWNAMVRRLETCTADSPDELWLLEHPPVFTQGRAGKAEHLLHSPPHIPVIQSDRGGQITYHGPGQLVGYTLLNLKRLNIGTKNLVDQLENVIIALLAQFNIPAHRQQGAPGVYVNQQKIASIGLRIKRHWVYHGIAINVDMDLAPYRYINPCGYSQLSMTTMAEHSPQIDISSVSTALAQQFYQQFQYTTLATGSGVLAPSLEQVDVPA